MKNVLLFPRLLCSNLRSNLWGGLRRRYISHNHTTCGSIEKPHASLWYSHERETYAMLKNIQIVHPPSWLRHECRPIKCASSNGSKSLHSPLSRESPELEDVVSFLVRVDWMGSGHPNLPRFGRSEKSHGSSHLPNIFVTRISPPLADRPSVDFLFVLRGKSFVSTIYIMVTYALRVTTESDRIRIPLLGSRRQRTCSTGRLSTRRRSFLRPGRAYLGVAGLC